MRFKGIGMGVMVGFLLGSVVVGGYVAARPAATKKMAACVEADGTMHLNTPATAQCPTGQKKVSWNVKGRNGAPGIAGAKGDTGDAVLDSVNCLTGQTIVWNSSTSSWGCRSVAITAQLLATTYVGHLTGTTHGEFNIYTPNVLDLPCNLWSCTIRLSDVQDHTSCIVTLYGSSTAPTVAVAKTTTEVTLTDLINATFGDPLYVNLSCAN